MHPSEKAFIAMKKYITHSLLMLLLLAPACAYADNVLPSVNPTMRCTGDELIDEEVTEYDGNAPMQAVFEGRTLPRAL